MMFRMAISVTDPISRAWTRMVRVTFGPFRFKTWLVMGFCCFLAYLGQGGTEQQFIQMPLQLLGNLPQVDALLDELRRNLPMLIGVGGSVLVGVAVLTLVVMWVRARGKFMLLDNVVYERPAVREPWKKYAKLANSLWRFNVAVLAFTLVTTLVTFAVAGTVMWPAIQMQEMTDPALWAVMGALGVLVPLWLLFMKVKLVNDDFIVPMMFVSQLSAWATWRLWLSKFLVKHMWAIVLFYLMKLALAMAVGSLAAAVTCATCCLAALPYVSNVVLLPAFIFMRCYSAYFVEQFGEDWRIFPIKADAPTCPGCGYDLRGNPAATHCPECGYTDPMGLSASDGPACEG